VNVFDVVSSGISFDDAIETKTAPMDVAVRICWFNGITTIALFVREGSWESATRTEWAVLSSLGEKRLHDEQINYIDVNMTWNGRYM